MSNNDLAIQFFLQLAFIVATCRVVGLVAKRFGQPQVVAEMIAGVVMGPSLFGLFLPGLQGYLFPKASMSILYAVSQVGLVLYMFLIGLEFQVDLIRQRLRSAASVSVAGILLPFALGGIISTFLIRDQSFFTEGVGAWEAALFMGAAMSITAFPMLARIIYERGLTGTSLGTLALAAGSMDDAAAWCVLAIVLASFSGNAAIAILAIGGGLLYVLVVLFVVKPMLRRLGARAENNGGVSGQMLAFVLMLLMICAWYTDAIRLYAVFGAFILGTAMPRGVFARDIQRRLEPLTTSFLLPLFFVYSGLNTRIGLVNSKAMWIVTFFILMAACFGKGIACWLAARLNGESNRDAMAIGTLMNARGLMELIILNIGLERGIITPTLFTILVIMAIVTTLMASPVFEFVYRRRQKLVSPVTLKPVIGAVHSPGLSR
jgi:Kef-type K+ transport system membrane component KefB